MLAFGTSPKVVCAAQSMYSQLSSRYKVNGSLSTPCTRGNGFAQGDPIAYKLHWHSCRYGRNMLSKTSRSCLLVVLWMTATFAAQVTVSKKSLALWQPPGSDLLNSTDLEALRPINRRLSCLQTVYTLETELKSVLQTQDPPADLRCCSTFKLVGSIITCRGQPESSTRSERVKNTAAENCHCSIAF